MQPYHWLNKHARIFLSNDYLFKGETPEQRIRDICNNAEKILGINGFSEKLEKYISYGWVSLSSPIWSNFGRERGLPCSCNGQLVEDSVNRILENATEMGVMSKHGAGCSGFIGKLRPRGSSIADGTASSGPVHFLEIYNTVSNVISQSSVRRGHFAAYLNVDHPDIEEFLRIKGQGHPIQDISIGVTISDSWMQEMIDGDKAKRKIWALIVQKKFETGYPYIFFEDTVNDGKHQAYKDKNIKIWASNMCSETCIPASDDYSFVCVLSSLNLLYFDDWKDTDLVETMTYFLDAVTTEYIEKSKNIAHLEKANKFAREHRAIGLGVLGWHSYLQSNMIPFESMEAKLRNSQIFKLIDEKSRVASKELAVLFGEPEILKGYGDRMTTRLAIAPTTSSSFILGQVSMGIEPDNSNYYVKKLAKGQFAYKNKFLKKLLKSYDQDTEDIWKSILINEGSVQHLDFLTREEKDVFKTFGEISQKEIVIQAAQRQKRIDQSQSLNFKIPHNANPKEVSELMIEAWRLKVKTLYYQRSTNPAQQLARSILACTSCEA